MKGNKDDKNKKTYFFYIIIIVFLVLLLFTSCNSGLFGKIGDFIKNVDDFTIKDNTNDKEEILNQDLTFDGKEFEMSLSDNNLKIGFSVKNISVDNFTCSTSNADVATCYVSGGHVVVTPKSNGEVTILLETTANGKVYKATTLVKIGDFKRSIKLSKDKGSIYLDSSKIKYVPFELIDLDGNVRVSSSNSNVASAIIEGNVLKIIGLKAGSTTITLSLEYNGRVYTASYSLSVIAGKNPSSISKPSDNSISNNNNENGSNSKEPNNSNNNNGNNNNNTPEVPNDPSDSNTPIVPSGPSEPAVVIPEVKILDEVRECFIETGCSISFKIVDKNTGRVITSEYFDKLIVEDNLNLEQKFIWDDEDVGIAKLVINPNKLIPSTLTIKFGIPDNIISKEINFKFSKDYKVYTNLDTYEIGLLDGIGTKDVIIYNNLFNGEIDTKYDGNTLIIFDKNNPTTKIEINTSNKKVDISYSGNETGPSSIELKVTAKEVGEDELKISGYVNGIEISSSKVHLNIVTEYTIILDANGGYFDVYNEDNVYKFKKKPNDIIDLTEFIPFKGSDDTNCNYYKFLGFNEDKNASDVLYQDKYIVNSSITLYAIYDTLKTSTPDDMIFKTLWIDASILEDEETQENLIKPGSYGYYEMNFKNTTSSDINLVGFSLRENTVCVESGCINMGYIIKYSPKDSNNFDYYLVRGIPTPYNNYKYNSESYRILNGGSNNTRNKLDINFKEDNLKNIFIKKDETATISLFWEWVDNDYVDTQIGKKVTDLDKYSLQLGINYTPVNTCNNKE